MFLSRISQKFLLLLISSFLLSNLAWSKLMDYKVGGQTYEGFFLMKDKKNPFILLIHDWDGQTDYELKRAKMLNDLGYTVFSADLFGKGVRPTEVKDKKQHTGELYKDRKKMRSLLMGALNFAKSLGADTSNAVAIGYCFGGAAVLEMARSGANLKGYATFHGGLQTPKGQDYKSTKGKIIVFHGTTDKLITMDQFAGLANELENQKVNHEMISYSNAPHAFTVFGSKRYRKVADSKSWSRFLQFVKETI